MFVSGLELSFRKLTHEVFPSNSHLDTVSRIQD